MAEVDRAPRPYRDVVDALWWAEKRIDALRDRRAALIERTHPKQEDPYAGWVSLSGVGSLLYRLRKDAESVALARLYVREGRRDEALAQLTGVARVHVNRWAEADASQVTGQLAELGDR